ncbi:hypothetical protein BDB00DRAFT_832947 [Zychaea mexicana]|uniref:uncharacterized protein n=1 Tax=Zychaea mexicana TaxID=64656 RepID=UPI0022FEA3A2|nr:uncharacterized protein BDB00DRAFT_832947 [Zychaea mexicana]KAI9491432.1 hypothetical protein BDB00DRAFT_832947 [Zychaea mexicana]
MTSSSVTPSSEQLLHIPDTLLVFLTYIFYIYTKKAHTHTHSLSLSVFFKTFFVQSKTRTL